MSTHPDDGGVSGDPFRISYSAPASGPAAVVHWSCCRLRLGSCTVINQHDVKMRRTRALGLGI